MSYFTERNGMREGIQKTNIISVDMYTILLDCCEQYYENIAWRFSELCPDGNGCCGLDMSKMAAFLKFEIPTLYRDSYNRIVAPDRYYDTYDQYALLDYIEFIGNNIKDVTDRYWHGYFKHHELSFGESGVAFEKFRQDINAIFEKTGLLYSYSEYGEIERVEENSVLSEDIEIAIAAVKEQGLRELLMAAIQKHKSPKPTDHRDAVEKIWDAWERLKTYYTTMDKKASASKIVNDIAGGHQDYIALFDTEFTTLTKIGNNHRIRHHETDKIDITDDKHYDYFFNRCLSIIALAIQYLE